MKVTMGFFDKCGVRGDATLCIFIFIMLLLTWPLAFNYKLMTLHTI